MRCFIVYCLGYNQCHGRHQWMVYRCASGLESLRPLFNIQVVGEKIPLLMCILLHWIDKAGECSHREKNIDDNKSLQYYLKESIFLADPRNAFLTFQIHLPVIEFWIFFAARSSVYVGAVDSIASIWHPRWCCTAISELPNHSKQFSPIRRSDG